MKIFHFADVHHEEKYHDEIKKCMDYIIKKAEEEQPDVIICSGDVTNSEYLGASTKSAKTIMEQFRRFSDIAPVAVVIGTPSHDGQTPELLEYASGRFPIHVSTKPEQLLLTHSNTWLDSHYSVIVSPNIKLLVTQIPAPTKEHWKNRQGVEQDNFNIAEAMGSIFAGFGHTAEQFNGVPHILNGHFSMKGSKITETQLLPGGDISIGAETLAAAKADLYCLGHIHMRQSYKIMGKEVAFHSGSTWRKNFGERNEDKGFFIHNLIIDASQVKVGKYKNNSEFIKTPTRSMFQEDINLLENPGLLDVDDFSEYLTDKLKPQAANGDFIKIKITIYMDDIRLINQAKLKRLVLDNGASDIILEIERVRRENSRDDEVIKAVSLPDKFKALENHRSQPAPDGVFDLLESVETMDEADLVEYAVKRLA